METKVKFNASMPFLIMAIGWSICFCVAIMVFGFPEIGPGLVFLFCGMCWYFLFGKKEKKIVN